MRTKKIGGPWEQIRFCGALVMRKLVVATAGALLLLGIAALPQRTEVAVGNPSFKVFAPAIARSGASAPPQQALPPGEQPPGAEISVAPQLDSGQAASALVTVAGGATIATSGADGSVFTLVIPPNAMLFDTWVTVIPLASIAGLSVSGGFKAGVQIEPGGIDLALPATLQVVPAAAIAVAEEISLAYSGEGKQVHAYGLDPISGSWRFTIMHFSGWAIAAGTDAEREALLQSKVDAETDRLSQELARELHRLRVLQDEGQEVDVRQSLEGPMADAYTRIVKPALDTAENLAGTGAIDAVRPGIQAYLAWERQMQLLGIEGLEAERQALADQMQRILEKVRSNVFERCRDEHDLSMAVVLLSIERQQQLLGTAHEDTDLDDYERCLTFELDFDSVMRFALEGWELFGHVQAQGVPIILGPLASGRAAPSSVQATEVFEGCSTAIATRPGTLTVISARPVLGPDGSITDFEVIVRPSGAGWTPTISCPPVGSVELPPREHDEFFQDAHASRAAGGGYLITGWSVQGRGEIATRTYEESVGPVSEQDTFTLRHVPR